MSSRRAVLIAVFAGAVVTATVAYWQTRSSCVEDGSGMRGEEKVFPDGRHLYFDGTCWTAEPQPPRDLAF